MRSAWALSLFLILGELPGAAAEDLLDETSFGLWNVFTQQDRMTDEFTHNAVVFNVGATTTKKSMLNVYCATKRKPAVLIIPNPKIETSRPAIAEISHRIDWNPSTTLDWMFSSGNAQQHSASFITEIRRSGRILLRYKSVEGTLNDLEFLTMGAIQAFRELEKRCGQPLGIR